MPLLFFIAWLAITLMWWALAFAPLPASPPDWLVVARQVCFGSTPTGLPEGYGWLTLYAGPGAMLGFLLVVWGRQLRSNVQALRRRRGGRLLLVTLAVIPLVSALWIGQRIVTVRQVNAALAPLPTAELLPLYYPRLDREAPDFRLLNQHGTVTSLAAHRGEVIVLTFAYAHCATICPTIVHTARSALDATPGIAAALWVVTLDPWRDTPGALPGLAAKWRLDGDKMRVLSADVETVLTVLAAYDMRPQRDPKTGDIGHSSLAYVIDASGRIAYAFSNPSRTWLVQAMERTTQPNSS